MSVGVLFDLDGVLIDSERGYSEFWGSMDKLYPTGLDNFAYAIKGNNLNRILTNYFPEEYKQKHILELIDEFERNVDYPIFPGVIPFLEQLQHLQIPRAIVTSSDKSKMERLYEQHPNFKSYFNAVITGDMVKHSKPNPECFILAAEKLGLNVTDCYIFEDSPSGIQAAIDSGAKVVALSTTIKREDINKNVDIIIDSFIDFTAEDMLKI